MGDRVLQQLFSPLTTSLRQNHKLPDTQTILTKEIRMLSGVDFPISSYIDVTDQDQIEQQPYQSGNLEERNVLERGKEKNGFVMSVQELKELNLNKDEMIQKASPMSPPGRQNQLTTVCATVPVNYERKPNSLFNTRLSNPDSTNGTKVTDDVSNPVVLPKTSNPFPLSRIGNHLDHVKTNDPDPQSDGGRGTGPRSYAGNKSVLTKKVSFDDTMTRSTRPRIEIRLMRAKSSPLFEADCLPEKTLDNDTTEPVEEATSRVPKGVKKLSASSPDVSNKSSAYWGKIKTLFRPKTSKSLPVLMSTSAENISEGQDRGSKPSEGWQRQRSSTSDLSTEGLSEKEQKLSSKKSKTAGIIKFPLGNTKNSGLNPSIQITPISENEEDENVKEHSPEIGTTQEVEQENGMQTLNDHRPEHSYSLLKSDSVSKDSTTVNFTRIPSLRRHYAVVSLKHNFTTVLPPEGEDDETQVIKEATHVQPLDNKDAVVTDILSNKMVLFDSRGFPKVTFAVEAGSEPSATCMTCDGVLAVTLKRQGCVSLWSTSGEPIREFGQDELSAPTGINCDVWGRFIVADEVANTVCVFNKHGDYVTQLGMDETGGDHHFNQPRDICVTQEGNYVISDSGNHMIKIFDSNLFFIGQFGSYGPCDGQFKFPYGVTCDENGDLYVADYFNNRISLFTKNGLFLEHVLTANEGMFRPKSLAVRNGLLYVTHGDLRSSKISVFQVNKGKAKTIS